MVNSQKLKQVGLLLAILFMGHWAMAQTVIKGVVKDAKSGQSMPFVSVGIKGTTSGTTTDVNGNYEVATNEKASQIVFSFLGYITVTKSFVQGQTQTINVTLEDDNRTLDEVVVKPKKEKYRNKNNPAVELIRQVIDHKDQNRMKHYDFVSYQQYEKMQMAISSTPSAIKQNKLLKKYQFVLNNVDTTRFEGKAILPIYIEEKIASYHLKIRRNKYQYL